MAATAAVLHPGYVREDGVAATVSLVVDGNARIVVDPGMVPSRDAILAPLAGLGYAARDVTHVFLTHHHPDHTLHAALFPEATVVDFWATYRNDHWTDHPGEGYRISANVQVVLTPGHTRQDATLLAWTDAGVYAFTHLWWREDGSPEVDPLADDQAALEASRRRVLDLADVVVPGHGPPFRTNRPSVS